MSVWLDFILLHNSQWIRFATQSYLQKYFWISLLHSLIRLLSVSLSTLAILLYIIHFSFHTVLVMLFCAIKRDSVFCFRLPLRSHVKVILYVLFFVCLLKCFYSFFYFSFLFSGFNTSYVCPFVDSVFAFRGVV